MGRSSVVGTATCYRLDGPGIESQWGPTKPPIQWVLVIPENKVAGEWC